MAGKIPRSLKDLFDLVPLISKMGPKEARVEIIRQLRNRARSERVQFKFNVGIKGELWEKVSGAPQILWISTGSIQLA